MVSSPYFICNSALCGSLSIPETRTHNGHLRIPSSSARPSSLHKAQTDRTSIQELYAMLAADQTRNELICTDVIRALEEGRSPIVLTERRDHLERLADKAA